MKFTHLHLHTEYSLLDGLIKVPELVSRVKEMGMDSVAITDHGNMYGLYNFWNECNNNEVKPIIGCELYVAGRSRKDRNFKLDKKPYHLVAIAKNKRGYHNLSKLVTYAHTEGFYYKPRVDRELLEKYSEGLIILSGCLGGELNKKLASENEGAALEVVEFYKKTFGEENYYIELQRNGLTEQDEANVKLIDIAQRTSTPIVATCDTHYMDKDDWKLQEIVWCISDGKLLTDENRRRSHGDQYYLKSPEEMVELFSDLPKAIESTQTIADMVESFSIQFDRVQPKFWNPAKGKTAAEQLREFTYEGATRKYGELTDELKERIEYELDIIHNKGYDDYFLVVGDIMKWARNQGMVVGVRGSAGGSVVAYCNDIINIEPIGWECYFERFLNPERPSPPDIDMDIQDDRRDELLEYVREKYGEDNMAAVCAIGRLKTKAAIRDVSRVLNIDLKIADKLSKMVHVVFGKPKPINQMMKEEKEFADIINSSPELMEMKEMVSKIEGIARHISTHACAYMITPKPLIEYVPLRRETKNNDRMLTQLEGYPLEELGLMKFDFLGLRNLTIIKNILDSVEKNRGVKMRTEDIPFNDKKTFKTFSKGNTTGVFQFESSGMKKYLKDLMPETVEDLCFMAAAYRPGPMKYIPDYIAIKKGQKKPEFIIPELNPILEKTNGFAIYQEQVIKIAVDIAGYSMGQADLLRRAMGKKKVKIMKQEEPKFKNGVKELGYDQDIADKLWEFLLPFADYGFNKAHAAGYAVIAYWTAYLKTHYPQEFIAGLLRSDINDTDRIVIDLQEAKRMGISVLPPNLNKSEEYFTIETKNSIRFGLAGIKNVGEGAVKEIIEIRNNKPFINLDDLLDRVDLKSVNKKTLECLIKVGAMDEFGDRNALLHLMPQLVDSYSKKQADTEAGQGNLFDIFSENDKGKRVISKTPLPNVDPATEAEKLVWEKELMGMYLSTHPLQQSLGYFQRRKLLTISQLNSEDFIPRRKVKIGCMIESSKKITTKNGDPMMFVTLSDITGSIEGVIFPKTYEQIAELVEMDKPLIVKGSVNERNDSLSFIIDHIQHVDMDKAKKYELQETDATEVNDNAITTTQSSVKTEDTGSGIKPKIIKLHISSSTSKSELQRIRETLLKNPGETNVVLFLPNSGDVPKKLKLTKGVEYNQSIKTLIKKYGNK